MKVIVETKDRALGELLASDLFKQLLPLLEDKPTLRQLKKSLGDKIEKNLDQLVRKNIVNRDDRHYSLNIPLYEKEKVVSVWVAKILNFIAETSQDVSKVLYQLASIPEQGVYGITDNQIFSYTHSVTNGELMVASVSRDEWSGTLPSYFDYLRSNQLKQNMYGEVQSILGDVAVDYYLDQVQVIVEKIVQKRRRIRSSIFLHSLEEFQIVKDGELIVPFYLKLGPISFFDEFAELTSWTRRMIIGKVMEELKLKDITVLLFNKEDKV